MLTRLKSDPDLRSIPVVMLTAESGRENVLRIAKLGVRDYLIKPFEEELIVERVGRIINLKAKNDAAAQAKDIEAPLQILVVDDKPAIGEQIRDCLAATPWKVSAVGHPGQALQFCCATLPDILLVSLSLPGGAAFSLFEMLRESKLTEGVPVLALSIKTATELHARSQQSASTGWSPSPSALTTCSSRSPARSASTPPTSTSNAVTTSWS